MDKKLITIILVLASLTAAVFFTQTQNDKPIKEIFQEWKIEHGLMLDLSSSENAYRFKIFEKNVDVINTHNSLLGRNYDLGINQFTAYSRQEFAEMHLSHFEPTNKLESVNVQTPSVSIFIDWVAYGAVSPVKYEGTCSGSYAFSAVGAIEGISVIFYKTTQEYSVQQIIDCTQMYGNNGCYQGTMINSFNYVTDWGINTWAWYPYVGYAQSCKYSTGFFKINGYSSIVSCAGLESALAIRPISVAVDGSNFYNYQSGIFDYCGTDLSLAVLLVGATDSFYRLKNAWGSSWGEAGYIRLLRTNNICGICLAPSYPLA